MENRISQVMERNFEIIDKYFHDTLGIIQSDQSKKTKVKRLYSARYWATYFMQINNSLLKEYTKEK